MAQEQLVLAVPVQRSLPHPRQEKLVLRGPLPSAQKPLALAGQTQEELPLGDPAKTHLRPYISSILFSAGVP